MDRLEKIRAMVTEQVSRLPTRDMVAVRAMVERVTRLETDRRLQEYLSSIRRAVKTGGLIKVRPAAVGQEYGDCRKLWRVVSVHRGCRDGHLTVRQGGGRRKGLPYVDVLDIVEVFDGVGRSILKVSELRKRCRFSFTRSMG